MTTTIIGIIISGILINYLYSQTTEKISQENDMNVLLNADKLIRKTGAEIKEVKENPRRMF